MFQKFETVSKFENVQKIETVPKLEIVQKLMNYSFLKFRKYVLFLLCYLLLLPLLILNVMSVNKNKIVKVENPYGLDVGDFDELKDDLDSSVGLSSQKEEDKNDIVPGVDIHVDVDGMPVPAGQASIPKNKSSVVRKNKDRLPGSTGQSVRKNYSVYFSDDEISNLKILASGVGLPLSLFIRQTMVSLIEKNKKYLDHVKQLPKIDLYK